MTVRDEIAAILADAGGDKPGRVARLKAARLRDILNGSLPYVWQPRANVSVTVKSVTVSGNAIEFAIDVTIRGVTKSLSEWVEGRVSNPDWRIINPPPLVQDAAGDVFDDFSAALKQSFVSTFGTKIADIVRTG